MEISMIDMLIKEYCKKENIERDDINKNYSDTEIGIYNYIGHVLKHSKLDRQQIKDLLYELIETHG